MSQGFAREARLGVNLHVGETLYYTANDSFAKADYPGLYGVRVKVQGGGGGGGAAGSTTSSEVSCGGGGGGGSYAESIILAADLGTSETVTVGSGGSGGTGDGGDGSSGAASSFGSHATTNGGSGANGRAGSTNSRAPAGGAGGAAGTGDLTIAGANGRSGMGVVITNACALGGNGGGSIFGDGGRGRGTANNDHGGGGGSNGDAYGAGGGGAANRNSVGANNSGGAGADGIVIVEVLYERKIAVDEDIHTQYLLRTEAPAFVGVKAILTTNESISSATATFFDWDDTEFDTDSFWSAGSPTRLTMPRTGYYLVTGTLTFDHGAGGDSDGLKQMLVRVNGTTIPKGAISTEVTQGYTGAVDGGPNMSVVLSLNAGDYIEVRAYQDSGSTIVIEQATSHITVVLVGE